MSSGRLFVISAPSGAGKTTILKTVMDRIPGLTFSISHTTRSPRAGEENGVDYHFVARDEFRKMIDQELFLEHAVVHDNLYGTSSEAVKQQLEKGWDVILDIDVQGAEILRNKSQIEATYIFISPPSLSELKSRLQGRGTEDEEKIALRLNNAKTEMISAKKYEYLIINDQLKEASELFGAIIAAERARAHRLPSGKPIGKILS